MKRLAPAERQRIARELVKAAVREAGPGCLLPRVEIEDRLLATLRRLEEPHAGLNVWDMEKELDRAFLIGELLKKARAEMEALPPLIRSLVDLGAVSPRAAPSLLIADRHLIGLYSRDGRPLTASEALGRLVPGLIVLLCDAAGYTVQHTPPSWRPDGRNAHRAAAHRLVGDLRDLWKACTGREAPRTSVETGGFSRLVGAALDLLPFIQPAQRKGKTLGVKRAINTWNAFEKAAPRFRLRLRHREDLERALGSPEYSLPRNYLAHSPA
jgi:hypothetical protein